MGVFIEVVCAIIQMKNTYNKNKVCWLLCGLLFVSCEEKLSNYIRDTTVEKIAHEKNGKIVEFISSYSNTAGKKIYHGPMIISQNGNIRQIVGFIDGEATGGEFYFDRWENLLSARLIVNENVNVEFYYSPLGKEIGQAVVIGGKYWNGKVHDLVINLTGIVKSTIQVYENGNLVDEKQYDIESDWEQFKKNNPDIK